MQKRIKKQYWLSPEENAELKRKVQVAGIPETAVIRILIRGYEPREKPDDRFYDVMRELNAIGNNINQLVAKANALGFVDVPMLKNEMEKWAKFQLAVERKFLVPAKSNLKWQ